MALTDLFAVESLDGAVFFRVDSSGNLLATGDQGSTTAEGGNIYIADSSVFAFGDDQDDSLTSDGANFTWTHNTGDLTFDNTAATGSSIFVLGTDTSATDFQIQNNSGTAIWAALGDSTVQRGAATRDTSHHLKYERMDDMDGRASTEAETGWVLNSGTDAQALDPAIDNAQAGGVFQLVTGDLDGTTAADASSMVWSAVPIQLDSTGGTTVIEARVRIKSGITFTSLFFGLTDSTALEEPANNTGDIISYTADDAVGFLYDTDATTDNWWGVAVDSTAGDGGVATTGVAPVADTWQILRIEISADGATIDFFIDNAATADLSLTGSNGVGPDVVLYPVIAANTTGGTPTSRTVDVDWIRVEVTR